MEDADRSEAIVMPAYQAPQRTGTRSTRSNVTGFIIVSFETRQGPYHESKSIADLRLMIGDLMIVDRRLTIGIDDCECGLTIVNLNPRSSIETSAIINH